MEDRNSSRLKCPSQAANMAPLLKSKDSNKVNELKSLKNDLLNRLTNGKSKMQARGFLSLEKEINKAARPIKLHNIKKDYLDKLDNIEVKKRPYSLTQIKALKFDDTYIVDVIFYTANNPNHFDGKTGKLSNKIKPAFKDILGNRYWMVSIGDGVRQYTINTPKDFKISEFVKRYIYKFNIAKNHGNKMRNEMTGENHEYGEMISYFETDNEFMQWYGFIAPYIHAFKILSAVEISNDGSVYNPLEANLKDISKISIANKYIETTLDISKDSFYEAIQLGYAKHHDNECIINAFIDHYEHTLMSDNKRDILTRHKIIMMMGKTEKNFIERGATIRDLEPIFIKYRLRVRIFDAMNTRIYKYDHPFFDCHAKPFCCMIKNNHIYVLNYDLKSLEQKQADEGDRKRAYASEDFYIKKEKDEDDEKYTMIDNLDDILEIIKKHGKVKKGEEPRYNLVVRDDNLTGFLFSLEDQGYSSDISHTCCKISNIRLKLNKIKFIIRTQQLIKNGLDGSICVSDEETYNKMNKATNTIREQLFKSEHLSYYNKIDTDILDECRSVPPSGLLNSSININLIEIDVSKAYSSELKKIKMIPIFNTFDKWIEYNNLEIEDYTLYKVSSTKTNLILNKRYNLLYGLILKQLDREDFKILYYKKPSVVEDCDYSKIVNTLWNTEISDDVNIDKSIKKIINNVVIGQLEKGINKVQSSCIFHTLEEARGYQTKNGGTINIITRQDEITTVEIVDVCPRMNENGAADLNELTHRLRNHIKDGLNEITRIYGPKRIKYEEDIIKDKIILDFKLDELRSRYAEPLILFNKILDNENIKENLKDESRKQAKDMRYEKNKEKRKKLSRISNRESKLRTIEKIRLENEWARKRNKQYKRADKPSDFKTYVGKFRHDSDSESSDGEEVLSEVSDFSDSSDDELLNIVSTNEEEKEILNRKLESIAQEMDMLENNYKQLYSDETFNNTVWDDTYEITTIKKIKNEGIKELYILNDVDTKRLKSGFRYIKELLLQSHNLRMYLNHQTLKNNNINVYSVKTDAFTIDKNNLELAKSLLKFNDNMGSWRVSNTDIAYQKNKFIKKMNIKVKIPKYEINTLEIKDEYDRAAICQILEEHKQVMIKANTPGCGKSYICEGMVELGHKVIFICPTNKLVQKYEAANDNITSVTVNKFFSIKMGDMKLKSFDSSEFNVFVFDEIYCNDIHILNRIKKFIDNNKDKIIIATGDSEQLKPVSEITNQDIDYDEYMDSIMSQLFKNEIILKINKRFKNKEDMDRLEEIKKMLKDGCNINKLILKHFKYTDNINESENNIAYKNETCKNVSSAIRKKLNKVDDYEVGEILICRRYIHVKKTNVKFQINFQYKIVKIEGEFFTLENIITGEEQSIGDKIIKDAFIFNYCATCHSSQGASINGKICIFDYKDKLVDWRWLWTAITRATQIENVYFYDYTNDKNNNFNNNLLCSYFNKKINNYKIQDKLGHREICKDYINSNWFFDNLDETCNICKCELTYKLHGNGTITSNITADRINNNICHSIDNCKICCVRCNTSKSNFNKYGKREIKADNIEFID